MIIVFTLTNINTKIISKLSKILISEVCIKGPRQGESEGALPRSGTFLGAALLVKRRNSKWFLRMNQTLDFGLGFRVWLRLDLPYVPVWPGLPRFKRLSRLAKCPGISLQ